MQHIKIIYRKRLDITKVITFKLSRTHGWKLCSWSQFPMESVLETILQTVELRKYQYNFNLNASIEYLLRFKNRHWTSDKLQIGTLLSEKENGNNVATVLLTYFLAQQPLKSFNRPLMRVYLSNSILVTLIFY